MMALSLMAEYNDVRLAEWPAHSLYFMGTKWIDLRVVYMIFTQTWRAADPALTSAVELPGGSGTLAGKANKTRNEISKGPLFESGKL